MPWFDYKQKETEHFQKLKDRQKKRDQIMTVTIDQAQSANWHQYRRDIITASNFGSICRRRLTTSCSAMVSKIVYPPVLNVSSVQFGREFEKKALQDLARKLKLQQDEIKPCLMYEIIEKDDNFWEEKMEPLLTQFYKECVLPEIIDSRKNRNMKIREPSFILEAQRKAEEKKKLKIDDSTEKEKLEDYSVDTSSTITKTLLLEIVESANLDDIEMIWQQESQLITKICSDIENSIGNVIRDCIEYPVDRNMAEYKLKTSNLSNKLANLNHLLNNEFLLADVSLDGIVFVVGVDRSDHHLIDIRKYSPTITQSITPITMINEVDRHFIAAHRRTGSPKFDLPTWHDENIKSIKVDELLTYYEYKFSNKKINTEVIPSKTNFFGNSVSSRIRKILQEIQDSKYLQKIEKIVECNRDLIESLAIYINNMPMNSEPDSNRDNEIIVQNSFSTEFLERFFIYYVEPDGPEITRSPNFLTVFNYNNIHYYAARRRSHNYNIIEVENDFGRKLQTVRCDLFALCKDYLSLK
ncbi:hypothetical protein KQX54_013215 [Cotesia glomerata]|uniref:Uncharacterized protein n=1 Tax=Cotesia glomerata TaxID=32391 RepID=A0AAV7HT98_COTGL|nr:hypothetical protein KQX54_013215 [Cotesia glomerata]